MPERRTASSGWTIARRSVSHVEHEPTHTTYSWRLRTAIPVSREAPMLEVRVLIVDDYRDIRTTLEPAVRSLGLDCESCDFHEALPVARRFQPDIAIVDINARTDLLVGQLREEGVDIFIGMTRSLDVIPDHMLATLFKPFAFAELHAALIIAVRRVSLSRAEGN